MNTDTHTQHTPGPWHTAGLAVYAANSYNAQFNGRLRDFSNPVARVCGEPMAEDAEIEQCRRDDGTAGPSWRNPGASEAEANARLIAAAPDLITLVKHVVAMDLPLDILRKRARNALAKAEGRA